MVKSPIEGGGRDVLHFSDFLASNHDVKNSIAIQLTDKNSCKAPLKPHLQFERPKQDWYCFLVEKANQSNPASCTQEQLDEAFIHFANKVEALDLAFYQTDFSTLTELNPIALIGRWNTVMFNRHLKPEDTKAQWQVLAQLPLEKSYGAIRGITDYMHSKKPCGFLIPEMALNETLRKGYEGYRDVATDKNIHDNRSFWRFVSYMPKRNSIEFYRHAIENFPDGIDSSRLLSMLAGATTGENHQAQNKEKETQEFDIWDKVCKQIDTIESCSTIIKYFLTINGNHGAIKSDFLHHLTRLDKQPNMPFLGAISSHIRNFIEKLGVTDLGQGIVGISPLTSLVELSDKLNHCVYQHGNSFYQGCQFYLINGIWNTMSTKSYTELAHSVSVSNEVPKQLVNMFIPLISTFSIQKEEQLVHLANTLRTDPDPLKRHTLIEKLSFFSSIFKNVKKQLNFNDLLQITTEINRDIYKIDDTLDMLSYFEEHYLAHFEEGFFAKKRQLLEDAKNGLNENQLSILENFDFANKDLELLLQIESELVRKQPLIENHKLSHINLQFSYLSEILAPSEFTEFLQRLTSVKSEIPKNNDDLLTFLEQTIKNKSLTAFNVIFLRNNLEKTDNQSLFAKIKKYIDLEKHITSQNWKINPIYLQETLATLILKLPKDKVGAEGIDKQLTDTIDNINSIASLHPHAQKQTIQLVNNLVNSEENYFESLSNLLSRLTELANLLAPGIDKTGRDNMSVFYALISHHQDKPQALLDFLETISELESFERHFFIFFITRLLNSEQPTENLNKLVELCQIDKSKMSLMQTHCQTPPYATIKELYSWLESDKFVEKHEAFSLLPFGHRNESHMFNPKHYIKQSKLFKGVEHGIFTPQKGVLFDRLLQENRLKSMAELTKTISDLKAKPSFNNEDIPQLLTTVIEVLARTAHQQDDASPSGKSSQELNTTQVMTAFAMLQKGQHHDRIINQIDTGEGKSRLMMVMSACKAIQGKTVDFMTSNMTLAERDYFTYQEFFDALNIPTGLIGLNTPPQLYRKAGVNFTDNSNLILLRNKSDIDLTPYDYRDENPANQCLMLDEEDKFVHDRSSHAFNYAAKSKKLSGFIWVYPLLVHFMKEQIAKNELLTEDERADAFLKYVPLHDNDQLHQASLANLKDKKPEQLKVWLKSAYTALKLTKDVDYAVTSADEDKLVPVRNVEGLTCYTRQVLVLDNGRPLEGSNFSDGVHQCLCAIENQKAGKEAFVILPENETQRTIYTHPFLDNYQQAYGVSGSTRADAPMANPKINQGNWQYMITPREKPLRRDEKRVLAAKDAQQQLSFIKDEIAEACRSNRPYLLICRDDKQSQTINKALQQDVKLQKLIKNWQYIHSLSTSDEEKQAVKYGGKPGYVTISSVGMFARGVDIRAENLRVCAAYVPTFEDEIQIKGRTGRFGKPGDYRMLINLNDEETPINGNTYNIEANVYKVQNKMALEASIEKNTSSMYADFLEQVHQAFIKHFDDTPISEKGDMLQKWQVFLDTIQKDWELNRKDIRKALKEQDLEQFEEKFGAFTKKWCHQMCEELIPSAAISINPTSAKNCFNSLHAHRGFFAEQQKKSKQIKTKWSYDKADDGQATIYQIPFAETIATLTGERPLFANTHAWLDGRGVLFPNLRATLNGDRPLFADLRAFICLLIKLIVDCFKSNDNHEEPIPEASLVHTT
ncbi:hypothetical protein [Legionella sp.]|uniref:hypothetical protein n=1 Tax=Legionella sp. TaxID=459 RepID=UPI003CA53FFB